MQLDARHLFCNACFMRMQDCMVAAWHPTCSRACASPLGVWKPAMRMPVAVPEGKCRR